MTFKRLSEYFSQLEATPLRNKMTEILAALFKEANASEISKLCYLLQGRVVPLFEAVEFGVADKMMIRAISSGISVDASDVAKVFKQEGDLGKAVEKIKSQKVKGKEIQVSEVYDKLYTVATASGSGSQEVKIKYLGDLLYAVDPLSARYIVKITLAKLRMGFSDMTILDSLSWMLKGNKGLRPEIERAYNVRPDLGFISETIKTKGIAGLAHVEPRVGTPILMARAERMTSGESIILKIGRCAIEPKYDGFRLQIHKKGSNVELFSRNLEKVTPMYPDITEGVKKQIKAHEAIFEGEAIAYNPQTKEYLPFQETVQRKRKYNIEAKAKEVPLKLFAFDILYVDGENLLTQTYTERRKRLEHNVSRKSSEDTIFIAQEEIVDDEKRLEAVFNEAVTQGLEGVMAKKLDGVYRAGARDFNWIKYKKSYASKLSDTIDTVVMGYDFGQGKRLGFGIGDFLIGIYDEKKELFATVSKIGTGLTDIEWKEIKVRSDKLKVKTKPKEYDVDKMMDCDVWIAPQIVVEIRADEITRSPVHTAGRVMGPSKSGTAQELKVAGYALRFPRLERFRNDKNPQQATTLSEVEKMYKNQGK